MQQRGEGRSSAQDGTRPGSQVVSFWSAPACLPLTPLSDNFTRLSPASKLWGLLLREAGVFLYKEEVLDFPSYQFASQKVLTMFEKQLDGQMAPEKRDHGNLVVKARYFYLQVCVWKLLFPQRGMILQVYWWPSLNCNLCWSTWYPTYTQVQHITTVLTNLQIAHQDHQSFKILPSFQCTSCCRFSKEQNLLSLTIEAPHLGPTGSCFKDGSEEQDFRWIQLSLSQPGCHPPSSSGCLRVTTMCWSSSPAWKSSWWTVDHRAFRSWPEVCLSPRTGRPLMTGWSKRRSPGWCTTRSRTTSTSWSSTPPTLGSFWCWTTRQTWGRATWCTQLLWWGQELRTIKTNRFLSCRVKKILFKLGNIYLNLLFIDININISYRCLYLEEGMGLYYVSF